MSEEKDVIHLALQETVSELTGYQKYLEQLKEKSLMVELDWHMMLQILSDHTFQMRF